MKQVDFAKKIIQWYEENKRELPWRHTSDPYKIWLSEIILQQTRAVQGLPYYRHFVKRYPTVFDLAKAPTQQVLRLWQGLGYYSRARNLHTCAKEIVANFEGKFPTSYSALINLKGVGPYTAAAVASIAYKEKVAVVDGNVLRVLSRIYGIDQDIAGSEGKRVFSAKANELISKDHPDLFNQAMMEFGALHCLPQNPKCGGCIFAKMCIANRHGLQKMLPIKSERLKIRNRYFYYFVIHDKNKVLMKKREGKDIWQGLYDFYLIEKKRNQKLERIMQEDNLIANATIQSKSKIYKHILSHQKLMVRFVELQLPSTKYILTSGLKWFTNRQIAALPKPILIANYLKKA